MKIENHKLNGDKVDFKNSPNISGKFKSGLPDVAFLLVFTASTFLLARVYKLRP